MLRLRAFSQGGRFRFRYLRCLPRARSRGLRDVHLLTTCCQQHVLQHVAAEQMHRALSRRKELITATVSGTQV